MEHVDGVDVRRSPCEQLGPGEEHCFAIEATGPEGVDNSLLSGFACATTTVAPTLAAPTNFQATEVSPGTFDVQWEAPTTEGITFTLFVDNEPFKEGIDGLFTTVDIPRRELTYEAELKVKAVSGDQTSDASNAVPVVVTALPADVEPTVPATTVAGGDGGGGTPTTAVAGGGGGGVDDRGGGGGGGTPTTAPDGATTTAVTTTRPVDAGAGRHRGHRQDLGRDARPRAAGPRRPRRSVAAGHVGPGLRRRRRSRS